jgi:predicted  nucleic acid-binding Zn-ribbon protein
MGVGTYRWRNRQNGTVAKLNELRARNTELQGMNGQLKVELSSADAQWGAIDRKFSELTNEIATEQRDRSATFARIEDLQLRLNQYKADIQNLTQSAEEQKALNARLQQQAQRVAQMSDEIQSLRILASKNEATLAARNTEINKRDTEINELSAELKAQTGLLDRQIRLLGADRDVRDLMGARNLHIIDIYDADGEGKDTSVFGRVFYTEGKSLIFYAFDLNYARVSHAKVSFVGWGESSNARDPVKALGIFYVDDATQRRWVLRVNDPEMLREIDAVFVSVEPSSRAGKRPTGQKLLYAYLNTQANHP